MIIKQIKKMIKSILYVIENSILTIIFVFKKKSESEKEILFFYLCNFQR